MEGKIIIIMILLLMMTILIKMMVLLLKMKDTGIMIRSDEIMHSQLLDGMFSLTSFGLIS